MNENKRGAKKKREETRRKKKEQEETRRNNARQEEETGKIKKKQERTRFKCMFVFDFFGHMVVTAQHFKGVHQIQATNLVVAAGMQTAQSSEAQSSLQFAPDSDH